ncbi:unnamed protein product [Heligmosomoides polygyrus]|uniref:DUF1579 domain-containing protein n=1 Tax=Heligmosomoides polygyrus TaxID=6339 RepID=A0A183GA10_HELPZ|nr:unnamed protein product [Heligmosomoides polygyrus]
MTSATTATMTRRHDETATMTRQQDETATMIRRHDDASDHDCDLKNFVGDWETSYTKVGGIIGNKRKLYICV